MEKPVVFKNKNGKQLVGIIHLPKGNKKFPLVLFCHGFGGSKTSQRGIRIARVLEKNKIASFRFDFEGCGDSEGNFETITVKRQVSDLSSAVKFILKQKWVDKKRIAFIGHSLGGLIISFFVADSNFSAKTLVLSAPAINQKKLIPLWSKGENIQKIAEKENYLWKSFKMSNHYLKENLNKDYSPILNKINIPILIIHGKKDDKVPLKFSKDLAKNKKNIKLVIYPKADHDFEKYQIFQKLIKDTMFWFKKYL